MKYFCFMKKKIEMDKVISAIKDCPNTESDLRNLRSLLLKEEGTILKHFNAVDDILQSIIDPSQHTLAYIFFL